MGGDFRPHRSLVLSALFSQAAQSFTLVKAKLNRTQWYWQVKQLRILLAFVNVCLPKRCIELTPEVINATTIYICTQRYITRAQ